MKKPLIVGVDPGITVGYAAIDFDGKIVAIGSEKNLGLNALIARIHPLGNVVLVGVDKRNNPGFVHDFAAKFGAKIIKPKYDLKVMEKNLLTRLYNYRDDHQKDSLASALFARRENLQLIIKIDNYAREHHKEHIKDRLIELVFLEEMNISNAVRLIEKPEDDEIKYIEKKIIEDRSPTEKDFLRLIEKYKKLERDLWHLKEQNVNLLRKIKNSEKQVIIKVHDEKSREVIDQKERRIIGFSRELEKKDMEHAKLIEDIKMINNFLAHINEYFLLKKLKGLGSVEFSEKSVKLNIKKGDMLYVENPGMYSDKVIDFIKKNIRVIVYKNKPNEYLKALPIELIDASKLNIKESKYFGIVKQEELEKEIHEANIFVNIIKEYQIERKG